MYLEPCNQSTLLSKESYSIQLCVLDKTINDFLLDRLILYNLKCFEIQTDNLIFVLKWFESQAVNCFPFRQLICVF